MPSSPGKLDNDDFAKRMAERRTRAKYPGLPADTLVCGLCQGAGVSKGTPCRKCAGFGFHRADGSIAPVHSAMGGFYHWAAVDAVVENLMRIKLAYVGAAVAGADRRYHCADRSVFRFALGGALHARISGASSERFARRESELWLLPTPAPDRARLLFWVDESRQDFTVYESERPLLTYRATQHLLDMQSELHKRERVARMVEGRYLSHPGYADKETRSLVPLTAAVNEQPIFADHRAARRVLRLRSPQDCAQLSQVVFRAIGAIAVQFELQDKDWKYQPTVEVLTL